MKTLKLHHDGHTVWFVFGRDPAKPDAVVDTNQYLVVSGEEAMLLDPGGLEIFPSVLTAVSETIDVSRINAYLCSHQDPDIMSSLPLWMGLTPEATMRSRSRRAKLCVWIFHGEKRHRPVAFSISPSRFATNWSWGFHTVAAHAARNH